MVYNSSGMHSVCHDKSNIMIFVVSHPTLRYWAQKCAAIRVIHSNGLTIPSQVPFCGGILGDNAGRSEILNSMFL